MNVSLSRYASMCARADTRFNIQKLVQINLASLKKQVVVCYIYLSRKKPLEAIRMNILMFLVPLQFCLNSKSVKYNKIFLMTLKLI